MYTDKYTSVTISWLDRIVSLNPRKVLKIKILYGDTLHVNMPIYRESAIFCSNSETILPDQHPESHHIEWDNVSDDQKLDMMIIFMI